jgi:AcrR family transcriptional regulator
MTESAAEAESSKADPAISRRELAVARSLDSARARAENRLQRFLDAALELMNEGEPHKDFTVQEVVERSGQSLRLFYQYFSGKHELLLALFEETVRSSTEFLRHKIADEGDALGRLHRFVVEYYRLCRPVPRSDPAGHFPNAWMLVDFAQQLLTSHPTEAALAFSPLVSLFGEVLDDAAAADAIRPGLRRSAISGMVLEAIMFNTFSATISGTSIRIEDSDPAEELWDLILHGIGVSGTVEVPSDPAVGSVLTRGE